MVARQSNKQPQGKAYFQWTPACQTGFKTLISKLTSPPVLVYPDFRLHSPHHASGEGIGAAQYKVQDGQSCVIVYGSITLSDAELKYSAYHHKFLALKWVVTEKFRPYLYGHKFHVVTDSNPLMYLVTFVKLSVTDHHWFSKLASSEFTYGAGKVQSHADGLTPVV